MTLPKAHDARVNPDGLRILGYEPQRTRICHERRGLDDAVTAGGGVASPSATAPQALNTVAEHDLASQLGQNRVV
jgi:hypothetical protein